MTAVDPERLFFMGHSNKTRRSKTKFTPPELAARWGIDTAKVHAWIRSGELGAIDASTRKGGRPRYLVDLIDITEFEQRRAVNPSLAPPTGEKDA